MSSDVVEAAPGSESLIGSWKKFLMSSIGSKVVMAVTGLAMWGFLVIHLIGNLLIFLGPEATNSYSAKLHSIPELLWGFRIGLITAIGLHIVSAIRTSQLNRAARPVPYAVPNKTEATMASQTMIVTGLLAFCYLAFHLAHLTLHKSFPEHVQVLTSGPLAGNLDVYSMLVRGFQLPGVSLIYILGMICLAGHLSHGVYSQFQHLGLWGPQWTPWLKRASVVIGYGMSALFISIPVAVMANLVKLS